MYFNRHCIAYPKPFSWESSDISTLYKIKCEMFLDFKISSSESPCFTSI